jgi:hypothetical protein
LWGLNGEVLTDDFPADHYHHHGVFWTWPHIGIEGKEYDLWAGDQIEDRFVRWITRQTGPVAAVLAVENGWFVGQRKVMIERVWMRVFRATDDGRAIDLDFTWIPVEKPITLRGADGKSYGGLTIRMDVAPRRDSVIRTPHGAGGSQAADLVAATDLANTPLPWADLASQFPGAPTRSGAAVFVPPTHPDYPPAWLTRHYGALCVGWPGVEPQTFPPGKPIRLSYRIWIHKTEVQGDRLLQMYQDYTSGAAVRWE